MARIGEIIAQDLGHAVRGLRRQPGFALAAISILALAIGATTAVASLVYGVLLRPLPYTDPDRLVRLWEEHPGGATIAGNRWLSHRTYWQWRRDVRSLRAIGGYIASSGVIRIGAEHESLSTASLTPSMIEMLGLTPAVGRWFTDYDAVAGAPRVAVLAHGLWREKFGARGDIIGTSVMLDDELTEIVGVAPPWMRFPSEAVEVWQPYRVPTVEEEPRRTMGFNAVARLAPGTAREQVQAEGTVAARSVEQPMSAEIVFGKGGPPVVHARRLRDDTAADVRPALLALAAAVALILLVACANVASLLLSRGLARERDAAIRLAIGSSRARLASQALMESAVLAALGGIAGTVVAWGLVRLLPLVAPPRFPRLAEVRLDLPVLLIAVTATIVAAVLAAVLPAWRCGTGDTTASMRGSSHSVGDGFRTRRARLWRDGLLVLESALAVVLLVGALLLGHSLARLMRVDPGYTPDAVTIASITMPRGAAPERGPALADAVLEQLRQLPSISAAGAANSMPMVPVTGVSGFPVEPEPGAGETVMTRSITYLVTGGYAEALGLRLLAGRFFTADDQRPGIRAILVNDEFVRRYLRGTVVGRRFERLYSTEGDVPTEIVGIVGNVLKDGHDRAPEPEIYFLHRSPTRVLGNFFTIAVRSSDEAASSVSTLRDIIKRVDRTAVVSRADRLSDRVWDSMAQPRFASLVVSGFAMLGLTLASAGLFAVLSHAVAQRRHELSIRAALGADRGRLLGMVLREGLAVALVGLGVGLAGAAGLSRLLAGLLFQVTPLDTLSFAAAPVLLLPAAAIASLAPAYRAASVYPADVLRQVS
jgi:predicted permease